MTASRCLLQFTLSRFRASELRGLSSCTFAVVFRKGESQCVIHWFFSVHYLSRQLSSHRLGSVWDTFFLLIHVFTWPVTFHPLCWLEGVRGDGRDHYITKHPQAIVLSNCHTTLPQRTLQASGQVLCATLQTHGGRGREDRRGRAEKEKNLRERYEGKEGLYRKLRGKEKGQGTVCFQGPNNNYSHVKILDICISMTQIMFAWTWKDCIKSEVGEEWWMSDWSLPPQSFLFF